jgi:hypothetical protein
MAAATFLLEEEPVLFQGRHVDGLLSVLKQVDEHVLLLSWLETRKRCHEFQLLDPAICGRLIAAR